MIISGIYKITFTGSYESYYGESFDIYKRWEDHKEELRNGTHQNYKLQYLWDTYGEKHFEFKIVATIDTTVFNNPVYQKMILLYFENLYIQKYQTIEFGLNIENSFNKVLMGKKKIFSNKDSDICGSVLQRYNQGKIIEQDGIITKPKEEVSFGVRLF